MKQIIIKQLHLVNFKGMREFTIKFNDILTTISGGNGLGKTSIFDAFTWLLFGKDSQDRKNFDIKTYDQSGKTIDRIPHEVSGVILIDGQEINLCRKFTEKWVKKRGTTEEVFTGNEEERLYNDVPMSVKEWNEKINNICSEQVFKFITNPWHFLSQKPEVQRTMLFRMAGDVTDAEIAKGNKDFEDLIDSLAGKTMDEYKREITAKKRRIKDEIDAIPERIDERNRDIATLSVDENGLKLDFTALETELSDKNGQLASIEAQIADVTTAYNAQQDARLKKSQQLTDIRSKMQSRAYEIKESVQRGCKEEASKKEDLKAKVEQLKVKQSRLQSTIDTDIDVLENCKKAREALIAEWKEIKSETLSFDENDFICPTCHRHLDIDDVETKQTEITNRFNARKAERLEDNNIRGKANKAKMDSYNAEIAECEAEIEKINSEIEEIKNNPLFSKDIAIPDAQPIIDADETCKALAVEAESLKKEINDMTEAPDTTVLSERKQSLRSEIRQIETYLGRKEYIKNNADRISDLEKELRKKSEELARLEGVEFTMMQFAKARIAAVEDKINGLFSITKFKMVDTQINGGEVEVCEAMADGIPYSTQNNAMRFNMDIDVINAICKSEGITAPIFADNSESVNDIIPTLSQMIRLVVTTDKKLIVK